MHPLIHRLGGFVKVRIARVRRRPVTAEYETGAPSPQRALDLYAGEWASHLPAPFAAYRAGSMPLFDDARPLWAIDRLGGVDGARGLERVVRGLRAHAAPALVSGGPLRARFLRERQTHPRWMTRDDIVRALRHFGHQRIETGWRSPTIATGPPSGSSRSAGRLRNIHGRLHRSTNLRSMNPQMTTYSYVDTLDALEDAVHRLSGQPILGVDTEAAGYHRYRDSISLIQISSRDETVLIDPLALPTLDLLDRLFSDARIEKVFHDADFDLRILDRDLGLRVSNLFDTQIAAAFLGVRAIGLGAVIETYLGVTLPKAFQRADWAERPLSEGMKEYAATDTAYLPALRDALREALVAAGRLAWAQEEFARREETRWVAPDSADVAAVFLRIKGARDLPPRALAILRELHAWREQVAEERDQAPFRILSNEALLQMGREAPTTTAALRKVRGVSSGLADRRGRDVLAAIQRGIAVPESALPRFPQPKRWDSDADVEERGERLREVRARVAEALNLDPGFLVSRAVLDEIARQNPASADELAEIPGIRRWQLEVLADELIGALSARKC